ncbi:1,2-phenylacetyl-CoA epoxidase subunit PaaD [Halorubellus sp. PRR65]|uniref:1,2-phenylacetyl-CoA epoxidase subunit PaaD n=1 Tax=Halorubellus sp. PRR65 TaxID=3098148 RepID=UPI002B25C68F|nr:1,2-phenylacetyl-CoA epoxidase subunit PaaD [Halorubellus sp. PRR65]
MDSDVPYDPNDVPTDVDASPDDCEEPAATACAYTEYEYVDAPTTEELPATGADAEGVERAVWDELYAIEDPEMPVSIVDLGLLYGVSVEDGLAEVDMTLTYSGCPAREMLMSDVEERVASVDGVDDVNLRLVWNPPWGLEMVTEQGKSDLNDFGLSV